MRMDESLNQCSILKSESRRDTIAGFFNDDNSSPVKKNVCNLSLESNDGAAEMEISSPLSSKNDSLNSNDYAENSPAPLTERRNKSRTRDSIACFFESPKYRSIVTTQDYELAQDNQETDPCVEMETSSQTSISEDIPADLSTSSQSSCQYQEKGKFSQFLK
jgi:hypothetical protein